MEIDERKVRWSDFTSREQAVIIGAAAVELSLLVAALVDLKRRPADQIRGPKGAWVAASFVNFFGPICYFAFGRRR